MSQFDQCTEENIKIHFIYLCLGYCQMLILSQRHLKYKHIVDARNVVTNARVQHFVSLCQVVTCTFVQKFKAPLIYNYVYININVGCELFDLRVSGTSINTIVI